MHRVGAVLAVFVALASADCTWPNGTDTNLHWWQDPSSVFSTYNIYTTDTNGSEFFGNDYMNFLGNPEYPIHLSSPLIAVLNSTNTGSTISHVKEDIALAEWDPSGCKWNTLPTFGLL